MTQIRGSGNCLSIVPLTLFALMALVGCSSSANEPAVTTVDPAIQELQEQVEQLEEQLSATTTQVATTTTTEAPKPAVKIIEIQRFFSGNTKFDQHECREIIKYSDGTEYESPRRWVTTTKDYRGVEQFDC